ncbi:MAG: hypothetical protein HFF28_08425, partial [Oscillospiraceae bacterium]|nr:hypothetical protein [Oscillospiraceae bacterium]
MKHLKRAICLALAALTLAGCAACGPKDSGGPDLDPAEILQAMAAADTTLPEMVTRSSA